jgi:uncharacterized protein YdhG (YjbR/CyaY superfamily)
MEKAQREPPAGSVDEYIAATPEHLRPILEDLRAAIRAAAPGAEERISYRIPSYFHHGSLVHFAAFRDHASFIVVDRSVIETFSEELGGFRTTGTTIHIRPGHPFPAALVARIVRLRMDQNERRGPGRRGSAGKTKEP